LSVILERRSSGPVAGGTLVEAAGQWFHLFRDGLDYAFILLFAFAMAACGACYSRWSKTTISNPSIGSVIADFSQPMSLYRANEVGLHSPLGVVMSFQKDEEFTE
jgi:hypothetical protein